MRKKLNLLGTVSIAAAIIVLSVIKIPGGGGSAGGFLSLATVFHLFAYLGLGVSLLLTFHEDSRFGVFHLFIAVALFGFLTEGVQYFISYRSFAVKDLLLNTAGASFILLDRSSFFSSKLIRLEDYLLQRLVEPLIGKHF